MLLGIGIIFAVLCALSKAIDTLINKDVMRNVSATNHTLYRILFVMPVLLVAALFNWRLTSESIPYILIYGVLEAVNVFTHQLAVKNSNSLHIEIISKSKVIFTLIVSFILMMDTLSLASTMGIVVFLSGAIMTINFQNKSDADKTDVKGILLEIVSVLVRTIKPFILKMCIQKEFISNETMAFVSMIIAFVALYVCFRPKLDVKEISVKKYSFQAIVVALGMLFSGWAITNANIVVVNAIESTTVMFVMIMSFLLYKKKYPAIAIIGSLLSVAGIVLSIVF